MQIEKQTYSVKYILAKAIRVVTIPPIMVLLLLVLVKNFSNYAVFRSFADFAFSLLFLAIVPFAAYPISYMIPSLSVQGREGQRNLAFLFNLLGYTPALAYGALVNASNSLMLIYSTYFMSVLVLTVFNKVLKIRASGHACCISGPLVLLIYFVGASTVLPGVIVCALVAWSSLELKRHTAKELLYGAFCSVISFCVSAFFCQLASSALLN